MVEVKGVSERSELIPGWAYTRVGLLTTPRIFSISRKKNIAKTVFGKVPKFGWNTIHWLVLFLFKSYLN